MTFQIFYKFYFYFEQLLQDIILETMATKHSDALAKPSLTAILKLAVEAVKLDVEWDNNPLYMRTSVRVVDGGNIFLMMIIHVLQLNK
jgi:hypothetical protein